MTVEDEGQYLGMEIDAVPKVDPDDECNGKTVETTDSGERLFDGYCSLPAGWGVVEGGEDGRRCKLHGGVPSGGAPANNQNASKHGLNADPHHYYESLSAKEKNFIERLVAAIENRVRENTGSLDYLDRTLARQVAIEVHIASKASAYTEKESGLVQEIPGGQSSHDDVAPLLKEVRRYHRSIFQNLKKLGVLDDPESQKVTALESWREFIEEDGNL